MVALYLFALAATLKLGHYPRCSANDPKSLGLDPFYHLVWPLGAAALYTAPLWLALWCWALWSIRPVRCEAMMFALGWLAVLVQMVLDPFSTMCWYAD